MVDVVIYNHATSNHQTSHRGCDAQLVYSVIVCRADWTAAGVCGGGACDGGRVVLSLRNFRSISASASCFWTHGSSFPAPVYCRNCVLKFWVRSVTAARTPPPSTKYRLKHTHKTLFRMTHLVQKKIMHLKHADIPLNLWNVMAPQFSRGTILLRNKPIIPAVLGGWKGTSFGQPRSSTPRCNSPRIPPV